MPILLNKKLRLRLVPRGNSIRSGFQPDSWTLSSLPGLSNFSRQIHAKGRGSSPFRALSLGYKSMNTLFK